MEGDPVASVSIVTCTPQGAAASRCWRSAFSASSGVVPGGMRRLRRARARGEMAAADPTTGGQSIPRIVSDDRAHSMSETEPSPRSAAPRRHPRRCGTVLRVGLPRPRAGVVETGDRRVALVVPQRSEHRDEGRQRVGCGSAEHAGMDLRRQGLDGDDDVDHAPQAHRGCRDPDRRVAGVAHENRVGPEQVGVRRDEGLEPPCPAPRSPRRRA